MLAWPYWWTRSAFVIFVVVGALVVEWGLHAVIAYRLRHLDPRRHVWHHGLLAALAAPMHGAIWLLGAVIVKYHFFGADPTRIVNEFDQPVLGILVTVLVAWFLLRAVRCVRGNYVAAGAMDSGRGIDVTTVDAVAKLSVVVVLAIAALSILQRFGVSIGGLLAFGGAAGVAVGFAAQTLVANFLGGFTIFVGHVFKIDEDIILPGTEVAGTVQEIGWRATRVMNWNGQPIYVPNAEFNKALVINWSRMAYRQISEYVYLRYRDLDKVPAIVAEGNQLLQERADIGYFVFRFGSFSDQVLKLQLYAYAKTTAYATYMQIKEDVLLAIAAIARKHGADLALPVSNVRLEGSAGPAPAARPDAATEGWLDAPDRHRGG